MGEKLTTLVETQLLDDLREYGFDTKDLAIDWSNALNEGHYMEMESGWLESASDIGVLDRDGKVAHGWVDFVYVGGEPPFRAFWWMLYVMTDDGWACLKPPSGPDIPDHLWATLADVERDTSHFPHISSPISGNFSAA